jgi:hypothetical protein
MDDERTTHVELAKLADLVEVDDPRRRVLENLDAIAQMAIDAQSNFMGKSYPAPELQTAIKALEGERLRLLGAPALEKRAKGDR